MIASMIAGGAQAAIGIAQTIAGLVQKKPDIPDYEIPQEVYENMTDAEYWSFQGLPETQKQQFIERSKRAGATAIGRTSSRKGGMGMISDIAQQEQDASMNLMTADVEQRMNNLKTFWGMRDQMSQQKAIQQEWGRDKVMQKRGEIDALRGAGVQNLMGALGTVAGVDALSDGDGFMEKLIAKRQAKADEFIKKTAPGAINFDNSKSYSPTITPDRIPGQMTAPGAIGQHTTYSPAVNPQNNLSNLLKGM
jgi:hypothetical protein